MQYACKAGHTEVVRHLLKWDSVVKQDVWREDSEFYLVSYYGHLDTAKILYEKYRGMYLSFVTLFNRIELENILKMISKFRDWEIV